MNVNKILPFLLLLPFLASCTSKYKIEGTSSVNSLDGKMLYLKSLNDGEWVKLDSAEVVHGGFSMKGKIDSVQMVTLYMDEESIMPIVLESGRPQGALGGGARRLVFQTVARAICRRVTARRKSALPICILCTVSEGRAEL